MSKNAKKNHSTNIRNYAVTHYQTLELVRWHLGLIKTQRPEKILKIRNLSFYRVVVRQLQATGEKGCGAAPGGWWEGNSGFGGGGGGGG